MPSLVVPLLLASAAAHEDGQTGRSIVGCGCHSNTASATTTAAFGAAPLVVGPGEVVPLTFTVSTTSATRIAGGLDVSVDGGALVAGSNTQVDGGEITHTEPEPMTAGAVVFDFAWTAPIVDGLFTFNGAGNAVNFTGTRTGDGWNVAGAVVIEVDQPCDDVDLDGVDTCEGDCDDGSAAVNPTLTEICDGLDNDCAGGVDDGAVDALPFFPDLDRDGFGAEEGLVLACAAPFDHVAVAGDCDDTNEAVNPGEDEVCDALDADQDCDTLADDATAVDAIAWYADGDGDGYGAGAPVLECEAPAGHVGLDGDCDDASAAFNPGAPETDCTDPTDWNCDGSTGFADFDLDGFAACVECDDADAANHPAATEVCDGEDDDCDGATDEPDAADALTWYQDQDLDGHGVVGATTAACTAPVGYAAASDDCDDTRASVNPDAAEVWYDDLDQDCDGNDDDQDGDGVELPTDCDDTAAGSFPGAADAPYDGVDADCAGDDDFDVDGDGVPAEIGGGDDCDDEDPAIRPGVTDPACDAVDVDCDPGPDFDPACDATTTPGTLLPTGEEDEEVEEEGGCGCESAGPAGLAGLLVPALLVVRRRRARHEP